MVVGTTVALFGVPVWAILTAGIIQVFPEVVGYYPGSMVLDIDGAVVQVNDARPTMWNWGMAGSLAAVVVGVLVAGLAAASLGMRVLGLGQRRAARDLRRYEQLAGDVVLGGVGLSSSSRMAEASEEADPDERRPARGAEPSAEPVEARSQADER